MAIFLSRFPARVEAGTGISIVKSNGVYTITNTFAAPATIPDLPVASAPPTGSEPFEIFQSGENRRITFDQLNTVVDRGTASSGTVTIVPTAGRNQKLTVGGAISVQFSGWGSSGIHREVELQLVNGGVNVTWLGTINWIIGDGSTDTTFSAMGVTLTGSGSNWIIVWSNDGGTTVYGKAV